MKLFTIEEANSLLPTVRSIIRSIQRSHRRLIHFQIAAKHAAKGAEFGGGGMPEGAKYAPVLVELSTGASKLESLGVQLKDFTQGLIDFPAMRDGRVVDRKSTRLNSSHRTISYAVFCLKKKKNKR